MNAEFHARIVNGKPRVVLAFEPGDITPEAIGGTIIQTMGRMVGPVSVEEAPGTNYCWLVFASCRAKWSAMSKNGAIAVLIEFQGWPPAGSELAMILAGGVGAGKES